jgi:hypothetical protein
MILGTHKITIDFTGYHRYAYQNVLFIKIVVPLQFLRVYEMSYLYWYKIHKPENSNCEMCPCHAL